MPGRIDFNPRMIEGGLQELVEGLTGGGQGELTGALGAMLGGSTPMDPARGAAAGAQAMATADARRAQFGEEHPVLAPALQIGGGLTSGLAAPLGAGVLRGKGLLGTLGRSVGIGGAEGATAGALSAESGKRGEGAAVGGLIGGVLGGGTAALAQIPRAVGGIAKFIKKLKSRPSSTATQTATDAAQVAKSEVLRGDTPHALETIGDDIARARKFSSDPDNYVLADHDAFKDLAAKAARFSESTNLGEVFDDALSGRGGDVASTAAMMLAQPGVASMRAVGAEARTAFGKIKARQFRAVMGNLADVLFDPRPQVQADLLKAIGAAPPARLGPINPLIGAGQVSTQQLLGQ